MTAADKIAEAPLPCPYCGSQTRISGFSKRIGKATRTLFQTAQVKCKRQSCGMSGPLVKGDNCRRMAVAAFNVVARRADLADALAQENDRLRRLIQHASQKYGAETKQIEALSEALKQLLGWVHSWDCEFKDDPEWPEAEHNIRSALGDTP